jgi:hypothetical protein
LTLRLPDDLHDALRVASRDASRSLQREIEWRLRGSFNNAVVAVTKTGRKLTEADVHDLAAEAEAGYDVSHLKGSGEAEVTASSAAAEPSGGKTRVSSPGKCQMDTPMGVKCKVCGKVHS